MDLPETKLDVKVDLTKPLENLSTSVPKGFARFTHILFGKRDANVMRHKILTAAQTKQDTQKILSGQAEYRDGAVEELHAPTALDSHLSYLTQQQAENVSATLKIAIEQVSQLSDDEISDDPVDENWFLRWHREASCVSKEELRHLFANLLKENIKRPDAISLRTLDIAKNLTQQECKDFLSIYPYISKANIDAGILCDKGRIYPPKVQYDLLARLSDAGLIDLENLSARAAGKLMINEIPRPCILIFPYFFAIFSDKDLRIPFIRLTQPGFELLSAIPETPISEEQMKWIANFLSKHAKPSKELNEQNNSVKVYISEEARINLEPVYEVGQA